MANTCTSLYALAAVDVESMEKRPGPGPMNVTISGQKLAKSANYASSASFRISMKSALVLTKNAKYYAICLGTFLSHLLQNNNVKLPNSGCTLESIRTGRSLYKLT